MKIKKKKFIELKNKYIAESEKAKNIYLEYGKQLNNYEPKYGPRDFVKERYIYNCIYHLLANQVIRDIEELEER